MNNAASAPPTSTAERGPTPTDEQIGQIDDAEAKALWGLAELTLHRVAFELLRYRPELRLLLIAEDDEGEWVPTGISADIKLHDERGADSIEEYEQFETAAGHSGELSNRVAELTGYEDVFAPFVVEHDGVAATCSLDLRAIYDDAVRRHGAQS
ncbi:hypothetical protein KDK95_27985 [Actinospica sp. MGRD01-02]|uniref:Uncharacterized protein n=1 Tax=Actinospica acidithermotolerans TaxID=2828514 RepID=A0A941EEU6_9ACTN|nr:hypothetical protein [Actinospica acidithermotolerans]MBR7830176.1 hypothetical protein [Actinospica acidithermotolerans]